MERTEKVGIDLARSRYESMEYAHGYVDDLLVVDVLIHENGDYIRIILRVLIKRNIYDDDIHILLDTHKMAHGVYRKANYGYHNIARWKPVYKKYYVSLKNLSAFLDSVIVDEHCDESLLYKNLPKLREAYWARDLCDVAIVCIDDISY